LLCACAAFTSCLIICLIICLISCLICCLISWCLRLRLFIFYNNFWQPLRRSGPRWGWTRWGRLIPTIKDTLIFFNVGSFILRLLSASHTRVVARVAAVSGCLFQLRVCLIRWRGGGGCVSSVGSIVMSVFLGCLVREIIVRG
jgi:hypothetical protein